MLAYSKITPCPEKRTYIQYRPQSFVNIFNKLKRIFTTLTHIIFMIRFTKNVKT